jgi:hypothetical protein
MANSDCQRSARAEPVDAMPNAAPSIRGARNVVMGAENDILRAMNVTRSRTAAEPTLQYPSTG